MDPRLSKNRLENLIYQRIVLFCSQLVRFFPNYGLFLLLYNVQFQVLEKRLTSKGTIWMFQFLSFRFLLNLLSKIYNLPFLNQINLFLGYFNEHSNLDNNIYICMFVFIQFCSYLIYQIFVSKQKIFVWQPSFDLLLRNFDQMTMRTFSIHQVSPNAGPVYDYTTKPKGNGEELAIHYNLSRLSSNELSQVIQVLAICSSKFRFPQKLIHFPNLTSKIRIQVILKWLALEFIFCFIVSWCRKFSNTITN